MPLLKTTVKIFIAIFVCIFVISIIIMFTGVGLGAQHGEDIKVYCDKIETECNRTTSVNSEGHIVSTWYAVDESAAKVCKYKEHYGNKIKVGWKLVDCFYDSEEDECPSIFCEQTDAMEKKEEEYGNTTFSGVIMMVCTVCIFGVGGLIISFPCKREASN